ncbi:MAG: hypothetical protein H0V29_08000 [Thermoleophilaceae bacterium]|nr:hypothetical protein [Thermoleophilaceae bacterium]
MAASHLTALQEELGSAPPRGLAALSEEEIAELAGALRERKEDQALALKQAGDKAFGQIPRLLRGPVKKMVLRG